MGASRYIAYLMSEPYKSSCVRSSKVIEISHDEVHRFLNGSSLSGKDLFEQVRGAILLSGGVLSVDDTVIVKLFCGEQHTEVVGYFWSGRHHKVVKGISVPVNFCLYRHAQRVRVRTIIFTRGAQRYCIGALGRLS